MSHATWPLKLRFCWSTMFQGNVVVEKGRGPNCLEQGILNPFHSGLILPEKILHGPGHSHAHACTYTNIHKAFTDIKFKIYV